MKNASHGFIAYSVMALVVVSVLAFAYGLGFLIGKLLV